jgi:hypothetical protein
MSKTRVLLAFLLAPLGPALYLVVMQLLSQSSGRYSLAMPLIFALPISYLSCVAFGVPLLRILRSRGALSSIAVVAVGSLLGIVVNYLFGHLFAALLDSRASTVPGIDIVIWGVLLGAMVAIPFVLIAGIPLLPAKDADR